MQAGSFKDSFRLKKKIFFIQNSFLKTEKHKKLLTDDGILLAGD